MMLMILQSFVFPRPEIAPLETISTHIKGSPIAMMVRYPIAMAITSGSWKNMFAIPSGKRINKTPIKEPHTAMETAEM